MKHKIGDVVVVKNREWYDTLKNKNGDVVLNDMSFVSDMISHCGQIARITGIHGDKAYILAGCNWLFTDEMVDSLEEFTRSGKYPTGSIPMFCKTAKEIIAKGDCNNVDCLQCPARDFYLLNNGFCNACISEGETADAKVAFFKEFLCQFDKDTTDTNDSSAADSSELVTRIHALEARVEELELANKTAVPVGKSDNAPVIPQFDMQSMYVAVDAGGVPRVLIRVSSESRLGRYAFYGLSNAVQYAHFDGPFDSAQEAINRIITVEGHTVHRFNNWSEGMSFFMQKYLAVHGKE